MADRTATVDAVMRVCHRLLGDSDMQAFAFSSPGRVRVRSRISPTGESVYWNLPPLTEAQIRRGTRLWIFWVLGSERCASPRDEVPRG